MPPYPNTVDDGYIMTAESKYINLISEILGNISHDIVDNRNTTRRLLEERKVLKCMLNAYAKAGLKEEKRLTQIKLKDNMKFLDLIAEDQKSNKETHSRLSASLGKAINEQQR